MIPGAKSCGSVGKLGDRADPEGATASNGDVPEARRGEGGQRRRGEERQVDRGKRGRERGEGKEEGTQGRVRRLWSFSQAKWKKRIKGTARRRPIRRGMVGTDS